MNDTSADSIHTRIQEYGLEKNLNPVHILIGDKTGMKWTEWEQHCSHASGVCTVLHSQVYWKSTGHH
jgi:hypothetical protein